MPSAAWNSALGAIRRANEQVTRKWQLGADFWPELWTGDMGQGNGLSIELAWRN
jgi:hypothetical protein